MYERDTENWKPHSLELHRSSIKGTKLLVIKAISIIEGYVLMLQSPALNILNSFSTQRCHSFWFGPVRACLSRPFSSPTECPICLKFWDNLNHSRKLFIILSIMLVTVCLRHTVYVCAISNHWDDLSCARGFANLIAAKMETKEPQPECHRVPSKIHSCHMIHTYKNIYVYKARERETEGEREKEKEREKKRERKVYVYITHIHMQAYRASSKATRLFLTK